MSRTTAFNSLAMLFNPTIFSRLFSFSPFFLFFFFFFFVSELSNFFTRNKQSENVNSTKCTCISGCKMLYQYFAPNVVSRYVKFGLPYSLSFVFHNYVTGLYRLPSFIIAISRKQGRLAHILLQRVSQHRCYTTIKGICTGRRMSHFFICLL